VLTVFVIIQSVQDLAARLPAPDELRRHCQAFSVLDAVFNARYPKHTFIRGWRDGTDLAGMDNGGGDLWNIVFEPAGVFLYGFDHESEATPWRDEPRAHWPGLLDGLPPALSRWPEEEIFQFDGFFDATLCLWRESGDGTWRCGPVEFDGYASSNDGSGWMFNELVEGGVAGYLEYAEPYFERTIAPEAVEAVLAGSPLSAELVRELNPDAHFPAVAEIAEVAGYPVAGSEGQ
jgi:hypothetical protein